MLGRLEQAPGCGRLIGKLSANDQLSGNGLMVTLFRLFIIALDLQSHEVDLSGVGGIFREAFGG